MRNSLSSMLVFAIASLNAISCLAAPGDIYAEVMASPESAQWLSPGHAFICLDYYLNAGVKEECYGFYSKGDAAYIGAPGLQDEFKKNPARFSRISWSVKKKISDSERRAFLALTDKVDAGSYKLLSNNCEDFVSQAVTALGWRNVARTRLPESYVRDLYVANLTRFTYQSGQFVRAGGNWNEIQGNRVAFSFAEVGHDTTYVSLHDNSRRMDLQLPLKGGQSRWRQGGPWVNWELVAPHFD